MSVQILKLVTGEDVIARVDVAEDAYTITKGFRLAVTQEGLMMAPLCPFSKDDILTIEKDRIVFMTDPDSEIETEYMNQTSNIITASGPTIAGV